MEERDFGRRFLSDRQSVLHCLARAFREIRCHDDFLDVRGDPEVNAFGRFMALERANVRAGKTKDDIDQQLFLPMIKGSKTVVLKPDPVDDTPVFGDPQLLQRWQKRRASVAATGLFPSPDSDFLLPQRDDFFVTRFVNGVKIDDSAMLDESPMLPPTKSAHKRGRHTREVSHMIVQRSLRRVESCDSVTRDSIILSPSTFSSGRDTSADWERDSNASGTPSGGTRKKMLKAKGRSNSLFKPRHRRTSTAPAGFTPGSLKVKALGLGATSPTLGVEPEDGDAVSIPLKRMHSASVNFNGKGTVIAKESPANGAFDPFERGLSPIIGAVGSKRDDGIFSHFDAVRKALGKSRARADAAEAKAELANVKLKELHMRVVELQREAIQGREARSPAMDSKDHWRLAAALAKVKKLENTVTSQERKLLMYQEELRQNEMYQSHLLAKVKLNITKKELTDSRKAWLSGTKSRGSPAQKIEEGMPRSSTPAALKSSVPKSALKNYKASQMQYQAKPKLFSRKDAELRVLQEKVKELQARLERMRRYSESRGQRKLVVSALRKAQTASSGDGLYGQLRAVKKALNDEMVHTDKRYTDLDTLQKTLREGNTMRDIVSNAIDLKHVKEDMDFQLETLIQLNKGLEMIVTKQKDGVPAATAPQKKRQAGNQPNKQAGAQVLRRTRPPPRKNAVPRRKSSFQQNILNRKRTPQRRNPSVAPPVPKALSRGRVISPRAEA